MTGFLNEQKNHRRFYTKLFRCGAKLSVGRLIPNSDFRPKYTETDETDQLPAALESDRFCFENTRRDFSARISESDL